MLDAGCWMLDAGCWMLDKKKFKECWRFSLIREERGTGLFETVVREAGGRQEAGK